MDEPSSTSNKKTVISAAYPPTSSQTPATLAPKPSILERLPNELSLLHTCHTIQKALATDILFKQLTLAAFGLSDLCERHQKRSERDKNCTFCQPVINSRHPTSNTVVPETALDSEYDEYGEFKVCSLKDLYPCDDRAENSESHAPNVRRRECVMPIAEKRNLQKQILQSRYLQLQDITAVEDVCAQNKECEREVSRFTSLMGRFEFDPLPDWELADLWYKPHHPCHILHGVRLPKAMLEGSLNAEGVKVLEKLCDWMGLNVRSIDENTESFEAYKTALDRAKKDKDSGKGEA